MLPSKRRHLALPFIVTAAASCSVKSGPAPASATDSPQSGNSAVSNPPPPAGNQERNGPAIDGAKMGGDTPNTATAGSPTKPTTIVSNPPPPNSDLAAPPVSGGKVSVDADGRCWWVAKVSCPQGASCNPPPPRQVNCPKE